MLLLVPSDPLRPRRPDPHFAEEAAAAHTLGVDVALLDHDVLQHATHSAAALEIVRGVPASADAVYRGWMISAARYSMLDAALAQRDVTLRTSAAQYRRGQELPGWHEQLAAFTPEAHWTIGADLDALGESLLELGSGSAVLRDYTKSLKHSWHAAALVPDVADSSAARRIAARFLELRGDAFEGGLVLRRFEEFRGAEARTWWIDGRCALVSAHPDTPDDRPQPPAEALTDLAPVMASLALPFVTADLVRRADGAWRVVEIGDGQVSDRAASCPALELIAALTR